MQPAIRAEGLAKLYHLGARQRASYQTLRESLTDAVARRWGRLGAAVRPGRRSVSPPTAEPPELLWALKDVSFDVATGEVIGIIGGNGAGKSTLLKVLSRITEPTAGRVEIRGRVGSLLEVGTGFHAELTGRENIYLSGAILGMSRREIARQFDNIVEFAGVERFLDTPAKRYSSGMYVRLAFAVAAHLEPEVLIVDEVLAVGDAEFQKKCLGKMQDISRGGRTVFFVSHNMDVVQRLCGQVLLMEKGRLIAQGPKTEIVTRYLAQQGVGMAQPGEWTDLSHAPRTGSREARFAAVAYSSGQKETAGRVRPDGPIEIRLAIDSDRPRQVSSLAVLFTDRWGTRLVNADTLALGRTLALRQGRNEVRLRIEQLHLNPGPYYLNLWLANPMQVFDRVEQAAKLEIVEWSVEGLGRRADCDGCVTCSFSVAD